MGETFTPQPNSIPEYRTPKISRTESEPKNIKTAILKRKRELALKTGEVLSSHEFQDENREANNETVYAEVEGFGPVIFKPKPENSEDPFDEKAYLRERAAYVISEFFDLNIVPTTVIRDVDGRIGCAQEYVADSTSLDEMMKEHKEKSGESYDIRQEPKYLDDLMKVWVLDLITLNSDRNTSNLLIKDDQIKAIDNGECFILGLLSFVPMYGKAISKELASPIINFCQSEERQKSLLIQVKDLLTNDEIHALYDRIFKLRDAILDQGKITENDFKFAA